MRAHTYYHNRVLNMGTARIYTYRWYIARFWYRAQVLSVQGECATVIFVDYGNELTIPLMAIFQVVFVDYGNQITVPLTEMFQVFGEDHMEMLKLVLQCKLAGVEPEGDNGWSEATKTYFAELVDCDEFHLTVTFLEQNEDVYTISVNTRSGTSLAQKFVQLERGEVQILTNTIHEHVLQYLK